MSHEEHGPDESAKREDELTTSEPKERKIVPKEGTTNLDAPAGARDVAPRRGQFEQQNPVGRESPIATYFGIARWHPFTETFCSIADRVEPGKDVIETRKRFSDKHPHFFRFAMWMDYFVQALVVAGILAAIVFIALRAAGVDIEVLRIPFWWCD